LKPEIIVDDQGVDGLGFEGGRGLDDLGPGQALEQIQQIGFDLGLRSKPESKALRFSFAQDGEPLGIVAFAFDSAPKDRARVTVTHEKLDSLDLGEHWKEFWSEWLDGVEEALES
jgi:hypothetical protein